MRLHVGTSEVDARVVTVGGALGPGESKGARVVVEEPIVVRAGDRFVLRSASPVRTIGGGVVADPLPERPRPRPYAAHAPDEPAALRRLLEAAGRDGIELELLPQRLGLSPSRTSGLLRTPGLVVQFGRRAFDPSALADVSRELAGHVGAHHAARPLESGLSVQSLRSAVRGRPELVDAALARCQGEGTLRVEGGTVQKTGWAPRLTGDQERSLEALRAALEEAQSEPPSVPELAERLGPSTVALVRILERSGVVVQVEGDRYYAASAIERLERRLRTGMSPGREYTPAELRDIIGSSRKFVIPILEYFDRKGVTDRRTGGRVLSGM